jgi:hypothetical protein
MGSVGLMTPQLAVAVQDTLAQSKIAGNKSLVRSLEVVAMLLNHDVCVGKHVLAHVIKLLK